MSMTNTRRKSLRVLCIVLAVAGIAGAFLGLALDQRNESEAREPQPGWTRVSAQVLEASCGGTPNKCVIRTDKGNIEMLRPSLRGDIIEVFVNESGALSSVVPTKGEVPTGRYTPQPLYFVGLLGAVIFLVLTALLAPKNKPTGTSVRPVRS